MIKTITCIGCSKFCQNNNQKAFEKIITKAQDDGFSEVVVLCEFLKNFFKNNAQNYSPTKFAHQNEKGNIIYF